VYVFFYIYLQLDAPSAIITGGQFAIAILVLLSFPLQCHPCRLSIDKCIAQGAHSTFSPFRFKLITLAIVLGAYLIAITVNDLSMVLGVVGATGSTMICYILPGVLYYRMRQIGKNEVEGGEYGLISSFGRMDKREIMALCLSGFGGVVMIACLGAQIVAIVNGGGTGAHASTTRVY
jgi:amino acid permease